MKPSVVIHLRRTDWATVSAVLLLSCTCSYDGYTGRYGFCEVNNDATSLVIAPDRTYHWVADGCDYLFSGGGTWVETDGRLQLFPDGGQLPFAQMVRATDVLSAFAVDGGLLLEKSDAGARVLFSPGTVCPTGCSGLGSLGCGPCSNPQGL